VKALVVIREVDGGLAKPPLVESAPDHALEQGERLVTRPRSVTDDVVVDEEQRPVPDGGQLVEHLVRRTTTIAPAPDF
jgi:hypothetical protein